MTKLFAILIGIFLPMSAHAENVLHTNRLAKEKSPYLLQHAHNPVDWYPWGEEAFEKAKKEDKPILLSIGYSTCHWCHVMEEESFENAETAKIMNDSFVSIKVDREERPDIDSVYMSYVMAATGSGGWPMNVFLTPDQKPFYGGTYFPPDNRYGRPGFPALLRSLAESWKDRRDEIIVSADSATNFLSNTSKNDGAAASLSVTTLADAYGRFDRAFDEEFAGFGSAPKFPRSHSLSFILRHWARTKDPRALAMVEKTLHAMAEGGMNDQLAGGFHRYSTDARWRIPHFEKMLYDQALLITTYLEAYQTTQDAFYARIARETLDYVLERMTDKDGGFYSAEDADSVDPDVPSKKREGAYFVWKKSDIETLLSKGDAAILIYYYGIEDAGNALSDPQGEFKGYNVLTVAHSIEETADTFKKDEKEITRSLESSRKTLLSARAKRTAPHLDDKVLTDWNGLMIAAFAEASVVLDEPRYASAATRAGEFISTKLTNPKGSLLHRYREGVSGIDANLNDHAFMILGYLKLYEATFDAQWIMKARLLADAMLEKFWDKSSGGFFLTAEGAERLIARPKEVYDGAVPSGNSAAALGLLCLSRFMGEGRYEDAARKTLETFSATLSNEPANYPLMLTALDYSIGPSSEIVLAGDLGDRGAQDMRRAIYTRFIPNKIVLFHADGKTGEAIELVASFVKDKLALSGKATVYVCRDHACRLPVTDVKSLTPLLESNGEKT